MELPDLCLDSSAGRRTVPCVPWGMAAYGDAALYVCIDEAYEHTEGYGQRNPRGEGLTGAVARINLHPNGEQDPSSSSHV